MMILVIRLLLLSGELPALEVRLSISIRYGDLLRLRCRPAGLVVLVGGPRATLNCGSVASVAALPSPLLNTRSLYNLRFSNKSRSSFGIYSCGIGSPLLK